MKFLSTKRIGSLFFMLTLMVCGMALISAKGQDLATIGVQGNTLKILLIKDDTGNFKVYTSDLKGKKEPLTLGTFVRDGTAAILGDKFAQCSRGEPIKIFYEKNQQGLLVAYLLDAQGNKTRFLLKDLIAALPHSLNCSGQEPTNKTNTAHPENFFQVLLDKDNSGLLQTYLIHPDGRKELLTFSNLLAASAELLTECQLGNEKNRSLYLLLEKKPSVYSRTASKSNQYASELEVVQIDAYGLKEEFNLDNLVTAAAETLLVCEKDKNKPLTTAPNQPSMQIKFEKDSANHLQAYLLTTKGKKMSFDLDSLVTAAAEIAPCPNTPKEHYIVISYEKDATGTLRANVIDAQGLKKPFNLMGSLMTTANIICSKPK